MAKTFNYRLIGVAKKLTYGLLLINTFILTSYGRQKNPEKANELNELFDNISESLQTSSADSTKLYKDLIYAMKISEKNKNDTLIAKSYSNLAIWHNESKPIDSVVYYYSKAASEFNKIGLILQEAEVYLKLEDAYKRRGNYSDAMQADFMALELFEKINNDRGLAKIYTRLCDLLYYQQKYTEGAEYCQKAIDIQKELDVPSELAVSYRYKADNLLIIEKYEESLENINKAITVLQKANSSDLELSPNYNTRGNIYKYLERYDEAIDEYEKYYEIAKTSGRMGKVIPALGNLGHVYRLKGQYKESLVYTLEAIEIIKKSGDTQNLTENLMHAAASYKALGEFEKALIYEELNSDQKINDLSNIVDQLESELQIKYETEQKNQTIEVQEAELDRQKRIQQLYIGIGFLLLIILLGMYFTIRNNKKKRVKLLGLNKKIKKNQETLEKTNSKLKSSLKKLKKTQSQLIQSEKMASLGELTAGIAHEIQNPLNFVNNFSDVSKELLEEMKEELESGDIEEAKAIMFDVIQNLDKINHHGNRADGIVKGMLQHSRNSGGERETTDINKLTDEYMRLAYHGLRAKDKSFNATLKTDFDESLKPIEVVPQEIGRVILNLFTNAFYACAERSRSTTNKKNQKYAEQINSKYVPTVTATTLNTNQGIVIEVRDNGNGIPKAALKKIFQPFFTTKPSGQGTGLGLSMSYDIIKKHGGELKVETKPGEYTIFAIHLPKDKK